ncbi:MAG TPA: hypothetical protein VFO60_10565, partial [Candidatus Dormibacteraeota bacterium]|nr:hypothetical protein [Candidatus Dormibacteraeota bacterium]
MPAVTAGQLGAAAAGGLALAAVAGCVTAAFAGALMRVPRVASPWREPFSLLAITVFVAALVGVAVAARAITTALVDSTSVGADGDAREAYVVCVGVAAVVGAVLMYEIGSLVMRRRSAARAAILGRVGVVLFLVVVTALSAGAAIGRVHAADQQADAFDTAPQCPVAAAPADTCVANVPVTVGPATSDGRVELDGDQTYSVLPVGSCGLAPGKGAIAAVWHGDVQRVAVG